MEIQPALNRGRVSSPRVNGGIVTSKSLVMVGLLTRPPTALSKPIWVQPKRTETVCQIAPGVANPTRSSKSSNLVSERRPSNIGSTLRVNRPTACFSKELSRRLPKRFQVIISLVVIGKKQPRFRSPTRRF